MYATTAKENDPKTGVKPLYAHNRFRPGRRELVVRRVDQARVRDTKYVAQARTKRTPGYQYNKGQSISFEERLADRLSNPNKRDKRYDIPTEEERIKHGRDSKLFRRVTKEKFPTIRETHGIETSVVREKLADMGPECFTTVVASTWCRKEWTKARHMEVEVHDVNMDSPMPSHFMRMTSDREDEADKQNFLSPVHAPFLRAHCARLGDLPEFQPMDVCTPVTADGKELTDQEFARGEIPIINLHVDNLQTMPHILAYCYMRDPVDLLECIVGPMGKDLGKYVSKDLDFEQREEEWMISKRIAANYRRSTIKDHIWFIEGLCNNANDLGIEDTPFWWAVDTAQRVLMDAALCQQRFKPEWDRRAAERAAAAATAAKNSRS